MDADAVAYFPLDGYMVGRGRATRGRAEREEQAELLIRARVS